MSTFPVYRPRRLRANENLRRLVRETALSVDDLIYPMFVVHGHDTTIEISAMPGCYQYSVDKLVIAAKELAALGIPEQSCSVFQQQKTHSALRLMPMTESFSRPSGQSKMLCPTCL